MDLRVSDLRKAYAAPDGSRLAVLDVPSFAVDAGEQVALVGRSGGGKTTFLHALAGIVRPDAGSVRFGDVDLAALPEARRDQFRGAHLGYVFQTHHLLPGFTALENVLLGMSFAGRAADPAWAEHLLRAVGLGERLDYKPSKLSVGQQQRVAVARALANRPALVLADEPTGALDAENADAVMALLRGLTREANSALLVVTHDRAVAESFGRAVELAEINRAGRAA